VSTKGHVRTLPGTVAWFGSHRLVLVGGGRLFLTRPGNSLEIWSENGSRLERKIAGEESSVAESAVDPTGTLLAQQRGDGTIVVRDADTGVVIGVASSVPHPTWDKTGLAFSGDGRKLIAATAGVSGQSDGLVLILNLDESAWVQAACRAAGRNLTLPEWHRFAGTLPPGDLACARIR
jgi:WD40 repeat protein